MSFITNFLAEMIPVAEEVGHFVIENKEVLAIGVQFMSMMLYGVYRLLASRKENKEKIQREKKDSLIRQAELLLEQKREYRKARTALGLGMKGEEFDSLLDTPYSQIDESRKNEVFNIIDILCDSFQVTKYEDKSSEFWKSWKIIYKFIFSTKLFQSAMKEKFEKEGFDKDFKRLASSFKQKKKCSIKKVKKQDVFSTPKKEELPPKIPMNMSVGVGKTTGVKKKKTIK